MIPAFENEGQNHLVQSNQPSTASLIQQDFFVCDNGPIDYTEYINQAEPSTASLIQQKLAQATSFLEAGPSLPRSTTLSTNPNELNQSAMTNYDLPGSTSNFI